MKACSANLRVRVGLAADQFCIFAIRSDSSRKLFRDDAGTLVVIRNDLSFCDASCPGFPGR